ncbi:MAG: PmoA family protein [Thermoguttaceae bacterium]|nr:PmoA family protein [Thermoguttaceae bacterium]
MQRRHFLARGAALASAAGLSVTLDEIVSAQDASVMGGGRQATFAGQKGMSVPGWGDPQVEHLTTYNPDFADRNLWIRKDNELLAVYRTNPNQKYPYLYPLAGPQSMVSVLTESAQPWPHHRGMFLGVDKVNGGNYWQEKRTDGQILSQEVKVVEATESKVVFSDHCIWKKPEQDPIMTDERTYTIDWRADNYYIVDAYFRFAPIQDVTIQKTNHGFFGVRVTQDLSVHGGGNLMNSLGDLGEKATLGKPAKWCVFWGARKFNPAITEGVAVFCPPEKPFKDCPWFTRDYGNISPMPFNFMKDGETMLFPKGETWDALYRTIVFSGTPDTIDLAGLWSEVYGG